MNYPYQLVAFIDASPEPSTGTPVYGGPMGWIPNVAIKRRFAVNKIDEAMLLTKIEQFCRQHKPFDISFTRLLMPDRMPESVIEVLRAPALMAFHNDFIAYFSNTIQSKFPDREGVGYAPHMTITWRGEKVIEPDDYLPKAPQVHNRHIGRVCLIKDVEGENSQVLAYFDICG